MTQIAPTTPEPVEIPDRPSVSKKQRAEIFMAFKGRCAICDAKLTGAYEIDHDEQRWLRGDDSQANLRPLCVDCHKLKSAGDARVRKKVRGMAKLSLDNPRTVSATPIRNRGFREPRRVPARKARP